MSTDPVRDARIALAAPVAERGRRGPSVAWLTRAVGTRSGRRVRPGQRGGPGGGGAAAAGRRPRAAGDRAGRGPAPAGPGRRRPGRRRTGSAPGWSRRRTTSGRTRPCGRCRSRTTGSGRSGVPARQDTVELTPPLALWVLGAPAAGRGARPGGLGGRLPQRHPVRAQRRRDARRRPGRQGWTVVSGGAFGIDAAAHRGALAGDGLTVAIVAGGLRDPYPRAHESLFARIGRDRPAGQRVSAGRDAAAAPLPGPQPAGRRSDRRDRRGRGGRCAAARWPPPGKACGWGGS